MGTRCLTHVKDKSGQTIITIYRQFDGYVSGHGFEVKDFASGRPIVNGISGSKTECFNGMNCFAASLLCHLKLGGKRNIEAGGIYIYPVDSSGLWEDYTYTIYPSDDSDTPDLMCKVESYKELVFDGKLCDLAEKSDQEE